MNIVKIESPNFSKKVKSIRNACRAILIKGNKILIGYGKKEDFYIIPGGGIENNETYLDCCKREVLEETGIVCKPIINYLNIETFFLDRNHNHHYFYCEILEENHETNFTQEEVDADLRFEWIEINKILDIFSEYDKFIETFEPKYLLYKREYIAIKTYVDKYMK